MVLAAHHPARERAVQWARDLLGRTGWAILDTETTGLDAAAQVIQVAVIGPDGSPLLDTLVRPHGRIPRDAIAIHGITDDRVARAPLYREVHPQLQEILRGRTVICYNASFDARMLRQTAFRNDISPLTNSWSCAMLMYAQYVGQRSSRGNGYRWLPLPRGPEYPSTTHQAIDDCRATLDVIRRMAKG